MTPSRNSGWSSATTTRIESLMRSAGSDNGQHACTVVPTPTLDSTSKLRPAAQRARASRPGRVHRIAPPAAYRSPGHVRDLQPQSVARAVQLDAHVSALAVSRCIRQRFLQRPQQRDLDWQRRLVRQRLQLALDRSRRCDADGRRLRAKRLPPPSVAPAPADANRPKSRANPSARRVPRNARFRKSARVRVQASHCQDTAPGVRPDRSSASASACPGPSCRSALMRRSACSFKAVVRPAAWSDPLVQATVLLQAALQLALLAADRVAPPLDDARQQQIRHQPDARHHRPGPQLRFADLRVERVRQQIELVDGDHSSVAILPNRRVDLDQPIEVLAFVRVLGLIEVADVGADLAVDGLLQVVVRPETVDRSAPGPPNTGCVRRATRS